MANISSTVRIFIRQVTVLDCAIWDLREGPLGRSWNVDVEFHGSTDDEGVVVDFSQAKKLAKSVIDDEFDHRLLIAPEFLVPSTEGRVICLPSLQTKTGNRFSLETYEKSLAVLPLLVFQELVESATCKLEESISSAIHAKCPKNIKAVKIKLDPQWTKNQKNYFNYLHSLRLHTGNCQRFHGHSNIVEVYEAGRLNESLSSHVASSLDSQYLLCKEYLKEPSTRIKEKCQNEIHGYELTDSSHTWISYEGTQGEVNVRVPSSRLKILDDESTIENISRWIHKHFFNSATEIEVRGYEGLLKGALYP
ncbi:hypothetical protein EBU99_01855 [bacterium]|nr:hypothetical protein [bacterium]